MSPRSLRPDLNDAVLEDRTLMAYSPFVPPLILSTVGFIPITTPPGMSANLSTMSGGGPGGGAFGGGGGNMGTAFYNTGFGMSQISIGNATGNAAVGVAGGAGGRVGTVTLATQVGSGAAEAGGAGGGVTRNTVAQGGDNGVMMYLGKTSANSDNGGYAGPGGNGAAPGTNQAPVPPAPPPGLAPGI